MPRERAPRVWGDDSATGSIRLVLIAGAHLSVGDERHRLKASTLTSHLRIFYLHPQINETSCCHSFRAVCDRCTQHVIRERVDYFGKSIQAFCAVFCSHLVAGKSKLANAGQPEWVISDRDEFICKALPKRKDYNQNNIAAIKLLRIGLRNLVRICSETFIFLAYLVKFHAEIILKSSINCYQYSKAFIVWCATKMCGNWGDND